MSQKIHLRIRLSLRRLSNVLARPLLRIRTPDPDQSRLEVLERGVAAP